MIIEWWQETSGRDFQEDGGEEVGPEEGWGIFGGFGRRR